MVTHTEPAKADMQTEEMPSRVAAETAWRLEGRSAGLSKIPCFEHTFHAGSISCSDDCPSSGLRGCVRNILSRCSSATSPFLRIVCRCGAGAGSCRNHWRGRRRGSTCGGHKRRGGRNQSSARRGRRMRLEMRAETLGRSERGRDAQSLLG